MNGRTLIIFLVIAGAGVAVPLAIRLNSLAVLRQRNDTVRGQAEELAGLTAENSRLSKVVQVKNAAGLSPEELEELLKLRSEIIGLRQEANETVNLRRENLRLSEQADAVKNFQTVTVSKTILANVGYATPEAAFQTFIWGMSTGNREAILHGLTGQAEDTLGNQLSQVSDAEFSAMAAKASEAMTGYQIVGEYSTTDGDMVLQVAPQGLGDGKKTSMTVKKVGGEWKISNGGF